MKNACLVTLIALSSVSVSADAAKAQAYEVAVDAEILTGWRAADGSHMAAVRFELDDGWKTYWRTPGDGGIPPRFTWSGSRNLDTVDVIWPTPAVYDEQGMISMGYKQEVIVPVMISPRRAGRDIVLNGRLEIGVCKDICVPETLKVSARLPADATTIDPAISVAITDQPYTAEDAGVQTVTCRFAPTEVGLAISAQVRMPSAGGQEFTVLETNNPYLWVAEAKSRRSGNTLHIETEALHVDSKSFVLDRDGIRLTVFGSNYAVDIQGCAAG